jgi:hypothetical protein
MMIKIKMTFFWIILLTPSLQAQSYDMKITTKDNNHQSIPTASIAKMTFALDQTHALVVSQKDSTQIKAIVTNIASITFSKLTAIENSEPRSPLDNNTFILRQNYPNPFNPSTTIEYELPSQGWINIQIFNVTGQVVRNLESGYHLEGIYRIMWNGKNDYHELVVNGIYFYQVQFNNIVQTKKLVLVR